MIYQAYEMQRSMLAAASSWAAIGANLLNNPSLPLGYFGMGPAVASALQVFAGFYEHKGKPDFGIDAVVIDDQEYDVTETVVLEQPYGGLRHFRREGLPADAPRMLVVAPMSGHYATLLRGTVRRLVENQEVWITDWADAKMVPLSAGRFDLDTYIDYLIDFLRFIGPDTHVLAVCQPSVPAFAAAAVMAADNDPCRPASLTLMGGPVDTRASPTSVNDVAVTRPLSWFEDNVIATVPANYPGAGRPVYPGFLQLAGFISMNLQSHMQSHYEMFKHLTAGDADSAAGTKNFYDEYLSVCDMTAEFYLQTIEHVFQKHSLPKGEFVHHGKPIEPNAIRDTALLAIEGERDDISGIGQTRAALDLAPHLPEAKKKYLLAEDVGHYGIFNGSKWRTRIAPVVEEWIRANHTVSAAAPQTVTAEPAEPEAAAQVTGPVVAEPQVVQVAQADSMAPAAVEQEVTVQKPASKLRRMRRKGTHAG